MTLGTGLTVTKLSTSRDYVVNLPSTTKVGATVIEGGRNVVIRGGAIAVPADAGDDLHRRAIYVKGATGVVHIEGVAIAGSGGVQYDGIDIAAPQATVQIENVRVIGVRGGFGSFHGDVVQPWGGVRDLRIDRLTATSNYQGLTIQPDLAPIGSAEISNVDLTATSDGPLDGGGHMLWLTAGSTTCTTYPVALTNVWVQPRSGRALANSVWPQSVTSLPCPENGATTATWPGLPVSGGVAGGAPVGGSFVPADAAGLGYVSPGYASS